MPKPDTEGRYEILSLHLRNKSVSPDVDLLQVRSTSTVGPALAADAVVAVFVNCIH